MMSWMTTDERPWYYGWKPETQSNVINQFVIIYIFHWAQSLIYFGMSDAVKYH